MNQRDDHSADGRDHSDSARAGSRSQRRESREPVGDGQNGGEYRERYQGRRIVTRKPGRFERLRQLSCRLGINGDTGGR